MTFIEEREKAARHWCHEKATQFKIKRNSMSKTEDIKVQPLLSLNGCSFNYLNHPPGVRRVPNPLKQGEEDKLDVFKFSNLSRDIEALKDLGVDVLVSVCSRKELAQSKARVTNIENFTEDSGMKWVWCSWHTADFNEFVNVMDESNFIDSSNRKIFRFKKILTKKLKQSIEELTKICKSDDNDNFQLQKKKEISIVFHTALPYSTQTLSSLPCFFACFMHFAFNKPINESIDLFPDYMGNREDLISISNRFKDFISQKCKKKEFKSKNRFEKKCFHKRQVTLAIGNTFEKKDGEYFWTVYVKRYSKFKSEEWAQRIPIVHSVIFQIPSDPSTTPFMQSKPPFQLSDSSRYTKVVEITIIFRKNLNRPNLVIEHELNFDDEDATQFEVIDVSDTLRKNFINNRRKQGWKRLSQANNDEHFHEHFHEHSHEHTHLKHSHSPRIMMKSINLNQSQPEKPVIKQEKPKFYARNVTKADSQPVSLLDHLKKKKANDSPPLSKIEKILPSTFCKNIKDRYYYYQEQSGDKADIYTSDTNSQSQSYYQSDFSPLNVSPYCTTPIDITLNTDEDDGDDYGFDRLSEEDDDDDDFNDELTSEEIEIIRSSFKYFNLEEFSDLFIQNQIRLDCFSFIRNEDLISMGISDEKSRIDLLNGLKQIMNSNITNNNEDGDESSNNINFNYLHSSVTYREISYKELEIEPDCFSNGFYGIVYRGIWRGQNVAVKKLKGVLDSKAMEDFRNEAALLERLNNHPAIAFFVGICTHPDHTCIITKYYPKGSAWDFFIRERLSVDTKLMVKVLAEAASGIMHLHREGFIHCDIAARNILIDSDYSGKVCDFGLSRVVKKALPVKDPSKKSDLSGPVRWMAPEVLHDSTRQTPQSDSWSFGVTIWEIFYKEKPYYNMDTRQAIQFVLAKNILPTSELPAPIASLVTDCLQYEPENRPSFSLIWKKLDSYLKQLELK